MPNKVKNKPDPDPIPSRTGISFSLRFRRFIKKILLGWREVSTDPFYQVVKHITTGAEKMSQEERNILTNFLQFGQKTVRNIMIPRPDIASISINSTLESAYKAVIKNGHTRTIVYSDTLDTPEGFLHIKDLLAALKRDKDSSIKKIVRQHIITTSSTKLIDLLVEMRKKRIHIAVVVDEYGGTEGIVTIEDVVEEIVGDIEDEHDEIGDVVKDYSIVSSDVVVTSARVTIKELEHVLGESLLQDSESVETIGGLVVLREGRIPSAGDVVTLTESISAEVLEANSRVIQRLKLKRQNI